MCHEADGAVCVDAIAAPRCALDGEVLAPADPGYAGRRDRWGSSSHPRPVVVSTTNADAEILAPEPVCTRCGTTMSDPKRLLS